MIKAVIFDFGQTLVNSADGFRLAEKKAQINLFSNLGLKQWESFLANYRRIRKEFHEKSVFSRKKIWQAVYDYFGLTPDITLLEDLENEYWETVKDHTELFPEVEQVLGNMNAKYNVALITNTQGQPSVGTHRISQFPELEKYFQVIIVAGEGGVPPKPDPEPFRLCLRELGVAPSEAVYVGDDWRIDICGAKDAGLNPVWLKHHRVSRNWPEVETSVPIITRLNQLLEIESLID